MTKNRQKKLEARRRKASGAGSYTRALREISSPLAGIPSAIPSLNGWTGGWKPGELITVASTPGAAASIFAADLAATAVRTGSSVIYFALHSNAREINRRFERAWEQPADVAQRGPARFSVDDERGQTVEGIRRAALANRPDLLIVDGINSLSIVEEFGSRQEELAHSSRQLKLLAVELQIPVVSFADLRLTGEDKASGRPATSSIAGSGSIAQDSDQIILLHGRDDLKSDGRWTIELSLAKHRGGPAGMSVLCELDGENFVLRELPARVNPILQNWANSIRAGRLQLSELFELYPNYWQTVTYDHRVTHELVSEATQEADRLERIFRRIWWSSMDAPKPTEPKIAAVLSGWIKGDPLPERETLDEVVVWDLGEDGENWLIEGTTNSDLGLKALALWIEEVEPEAAEGYENFPEDLRSSFTLREDWFWRDLNPSYPNEDMELCWKSRDAHRWSGEPLFRGIHAGS